MFSATLNRTTGFSAAACRFMSTATKPMRAYPVYTVYGADCYFNLKVILPKFRMTKMNVLTTEGYSQNGSLLLEWIPRGDDGKGIPDKALRFALSPQEAGLVIDQTLQETMEFSRTGVMMDKVFRVTPQPAGAVQFRFDYEKDGVGGQCPADRSDLQGIAPLEIVLQRGDYVVVRELIKSSIPTITNWDFMLRMQVESAIAEAVSKRSDEPAPYNVPF